MSNHDESKYGGLAILGIVRWYASRVSVTPNISKSMAKLFTVLYVTILAININLSVTLTGGV